LDFGKQFFFYSDPHKSSNEQERKAKRRLSDATEGDTEQSQRSTTDRLAQDVQRTLEVLLTLLYVFTTVSAQIRRL